MNTNDINWTAPVSAIDPDWRAAVRRIVTVVSDDIVTLSRDNPVDPGRLASVLLAYLGGLDDREKAGKTPPRTALLRCSSASFANSLLVAARHGLMPDRHHGDLIVRAGLCTFGVSYRGAMTIMQRAGYEVQAFAVRERDTWDATCTDGRWSFAYKQAAGDRSKDALVRTCAALIDPRAGRVIRVVELGRAEWDRAARSGGPLWASEPEAMRIKTAILRLGSLPIPGVQATALEAAGYENALADSPTLSRAAGALAVALADARDEEAAQSEVEVPVIGEHVLTAEQRIRVAAWRETGKLERLAAKRAEFVASAARNMRRPSAADLKLFEVETSADADADLAKQAADLAKQAARHEAEESVPSTGSVARMRGVLETVATLDALAAWEAVCPAAMRRALADDLAARRVALGSDS